MSDKTIVIYDADDRMTITTFPAPADKYAARSLWCFLVESLQPGYIVELQIAGGAAEITRLSGANVPTELYRSLMDK